MFIMSKESLQIERSLLTQIRSTVKAWVDEANFSDWNEEELRYRQLLEKIDKILS